MLKNLHTEWGLVSFSRPEGSLVYINYKKKGALNNGFGTNSKVLYAPHIFNNRKVRVLNESRIVYDI